MQGAIAEEQITVVRLTLQARFAREDLFLTNLSVPGHQLNQ